MRNARWFWSAAAFLVAMPLEAGAAVQDVRPMSDSQGLPPEAPGARQSANKFIVSSGDGYDTDLATRPVVRSDALTFDVGGFKLGMSANEVERIARARDLRTGMTKRLQPFKDTLDGDRMPSFETLAANIAADRLHARRAAPVRVLNHVLLTDRLGNRYQLRFVPLETGPALNSIAYTTSMNGNSAAAYLSALKDRYGPPSSASIGGSGFNAAWCASADPTCQTSPYLKATADGAQVDMYLETGYLYWKALDQRIEAKGAAIAAASARKPVF